MRAFLYILAPIAALLVTAAVWAAVLPACAAAPWLGRFTPADCPQPPTPASLALAAERTRGAALHAELRRLERDLSAMAACERPAILAEGDRLDPTLWAARDVGVMEGCWAFGTDLARVSSTEGVVVPAESWEVCFDEAGVGTQEIAFADGAACNGPISAAFGADGRLVLRDAAPAQCAPPPALEARAGSCTLDALHRGRCVLSDGAATAEIVLRRAE